MQPTRGQAGQTEFVSQVPSSLNRELRRKVLAENSARIVEAQIIDYCRRKDLVVGNQVLFGIAVDPTVPVYVAAKTSYAHCRRLGVTEVDSIVTAEIMVQSQGVASFVLLNEALHYVISDQTGIIYKVFARRRH